MAARCLRAGAAVLALATLPAASGRAQVPAQWQADERVVIGPFAHVVAVAGDAWSVHAATAAGLASYDPATRRWALPLTVEDGYPVHEQPTALAALRGEQTLVLGTAAGGLWRIDLPGRRIERLAAVPGPVQRVLAGELGAVYLQTPRGWYELAGGSAFPEPLRGAPPGARERPDPRLAALRGRIGLDARLQRWPLTGVTEGTRTDEYFVGTAGGGLVRVDALTHEVQPLPFGLGSHGAGSILVGSGGVWLGGDGTARGGANVAFADSTLARWAWPGGPADALPRALVAAIAEHAGAVWFAADDGLFRHVPERQSWTRFDARAGLPADRATALLPADSVLWVGTDRGACAWSGASCGRTLLPGHHVTALASCSGTLWLGTERGLFRAAAAGDARPVDHAELAAQRITGLACDGGTLAAATSRRLWLGGAGGWSDQPRAVPRGRIRAVAADAGTLWVASDGGIARRGADGGAWTYYSVPADVPLAPIGAITAAGHHLWLATPGGAVRLEVRR